MAVGAPPTAYGGGAGAGAGAASDAVLLPVTLDAAVESLRADRFYREAFSHTVVDYLVMMKQAERPADTIGCGRNPATAGGE